MPGIICSVYDPSKADTASKWRHGLKLAQFHPEHKLEIHSEPGFHLACLYHPAVCTAPRILVSDDFVIACYGNIYEENLASFPDTTSPCHMLLERFRSAGTASLQSLNGRYVIAVYERRTGTLHFVGDRFGANRHYALHRNGALHIACDVKSLAVFLDRIDVDPAGLASMLAFGYHLGDLTLVKDIKCLPNAVSIEYHAHNGRLSSRRYWNYPYGEMECLPENRDELADALHSHLLTAVKRRLKDVDHILLPISGGLDSRTLAGLLIQSGYTGNVLACSYGQPGSRDVRYGRAVAHKLGYRHITLPAPHDFVSRFLEIDAWRHDAEWSAELHWAVRFSLGSSELELNPGSQVLSGMFGDMTLGSDRHDYRRQAGETPLPAARLASLYISNNQEYGPLQHALNLLEPGMAAEAGVVLQEIIEKNLQPAAQLPPYYALFRTEFEQRQRRHTAMVAQCIEEGRRALTPFLDNNVVEFSMRIPYELFHNKKLYKCMIKRHLPALADIPYANTGLPLSAAPIRQAVQWRADKLMRHFPRLRQKIRKRNAMLNFHDGVMTQREFFRAHIQVLRELEPVLQYEAAAARYQALLDGNAGPADQICAFLPPALYIRELRQRVSPVDPG